MNLKNQPVLILDCQTTGMRPSVGRILEIGWTRSSADQACCEIESFLIQGEEGEDLPHRIQEITGITLKDLEAGYAEDVMFDRLRNILAEVHPAPVIAHYAQFEKGFLDDLYRRKLSIERDFEVLCTHRIAKRLFPGLPSQNIRGIAGFFGSKVSEFKRSASHVMATVEIWKAIVSRLSEIGIHDFEALETWMKEKPKAKAAPYEYRMDRLSRLSLSTKPGIYRMLAKDGQILYVGKATSLKSRVNSYFRGQKNRDRRKLEMLAQVWDLQVTECETPLEAAIMETDEIKKWDPPYNVSLKTKSRQMVFYSEDFEDQNPQKTDIYRYGPYRPMDSMYSLKLVSEWLESDEAIPIFYLPIEEEVMKAGYKIFWEKLKLGEVGPQTVRELLAIALSQLRKFRRQFPDKDLEDVFAEQKAEKEETDEIDADEVANKFERLFLRAAQTNRRARTLTRLLNSKIHISDRPLHFAGGVMGSTYSDSNKTWENASIADFDRMSVLLSEVRKHGYKVEFL